MKEIVLVFNYQGTLGDAFNKMKDFMKNYYDKIFKSITTDNGTEFSDFLNIIKDTKTKIYFYLNILFLVHVQVFVYL